MLELISSNPNAITTPQVDVVCYRQFSAFSLLTPRATTWVDDNVELEEWQRQSLACVVEKRYFDTILGCMHDDGIVVREI